MSKLIRLLQQAHAIEIGAYHAYEGHWRSLLKKNCKDSTQVFFIQDEELGHKFAIESMLRELEVRPNKFLDAILWTIGKSISIACYVIGYRAAMWGAKIMEVMGSNIYKKMARVARDEGYPAMGVEFDYMQRTEEEHEEFFRSRLETV